MFFSRPDAGERVILVHLQLSNRHIDAVSNPQEFEELTLSAGAEPVDSLSVRISNPHPKWFIGSGKVELLQSMVQTHTADLVIFSHGLSPAQERNLEQQLHCRVLDRTGLILDIFAQRARTHEGKLQVELAQLRHMSTRLIRGWTHLERQKGGIGLRGPGETQLETDRRLLRARIKFIEKRLDKVRKQRQQGRRSRLRASLPTISLVGYTNTGKSTLFNRLTQANVLAENKLFATLDPTMRRIDLPNVGAAVLADTVGFLSHLPHRLVEAFKATLEEVSGASLLIHVVDAASDNRQDRMDQVASVLEEIGAGELPQLVVFNKIDLLEDLAPRIERDAAGKPVAVWISAMADTGIDLLIQALSERLSNDMVDGQLLLPVSLSRLRARLYQQEAVIAETHCEDGSSKLAIRIARPDLFHILAAESLAIDNLEWTDFNPVH